MKWRVAGTRTTVEVIRLSMAGPGDPEDWSHPRGDGEYFLVREVGRVSYVKSVEELATIVDVSRLEEIEG